MIKFLKYTKKHINYRIELLIYRRRAIITCGLYIFYPTYHCGLYCRAVSVRDNLCSKQDFFFQFLGLKSAVYNIESGFKPRADYDGARTVSN